MQYLELIVQCDNIALIEENLEELCDSIIINGVSGFEVESGNILDLSFSRWNIKLFPSNLDMQELINIIKIKSEFLFFDIVSFRIITDNTNYILANESLGMIEFDKVIIYNSNNQFNEHSNIDKLPILITQGMGFGTGKHHTTAMCINFIEDLVKQKIDVNQALDLGCGSGILAIVVAKIFANAHILASDIDEFAIDTACDFIKKNHVEHQIKSIVSNGFTNLDGNKYNLILANILLEPLLSMVNDFYNALENNGYLVVSGFLDFQKDQLINNYKDRGFSLLDTKTSDQWCALLFSK